MVGRRLLLLVPLLAVTTAVPPAAAHTQVQRASPGPGEVVEGEVGSVVLDFLDPVLPTPTITVTGPDGAPVPGLGQARMAADDVAEVEFDPLTAAGDYQVDYTYVAVDGATQEGAHQFTFQPSGGADLDGRVVLAWIVGVVLVVLVAAAVAGRRRGDA
ncbi:MAG: copper resistance protein CopC [Acidimicrobiia bacterium]